MMNGNVADEAVVRIGYGRGWATNITTVGNEIEDTAITSDALRRAQGMLWSRSCFTTPPQ